MKRLFMRGKVVKMETKQKENSRQPEMEREEIVDTEYPEETLISDQINSSDGKTEDKTFLSKHKSLIKICRAVFIAIGTLLLGIAAFITVMRPNRLDVNFNSEQLNQLAQAIKSKETPQVEKTLREFEGNPKVPELGRAIAEAYRLQQVGKIDDSIEKWRSIANISEGKDNHLAALAFFAVGYLYSEKKDITKAISFYTEAISLDPDFTDLYIVSRGIAYSKLGKYREAVSDFNEAIKRNPDDAEAYTSRGIVYSELGLNEEAVSDFSEAIKWDPDALEAYTSRGFVYSRLGKYKEANSDFDKAIKQDPSFVEAYIGRGLMYYKLEKYKEAIADFDKAIEWDPDSVEAYIGRGTAKGKSGKIKEAKIDFQTALEFAKQQENQNTITTLKNMIQQIKDKE